MLHDFRLEFSTTLALPKAADRFVFAVDQFRAPAAHGVEHAQSAHHGSHDTLAAAQTVATAETAEFTPRFADHDLRGLPVNEHGGLDHQMAWKLPDWHHVPLV